MKSARLRFYILSLILISLATNGAFFSSQIDKIQTQGLALGDPWGKLWLRSANDSFNAVAISLSTAFVAGSTLSDSDNVDEDIILIKFDSEGEPLWNQTWHTSYNETAYALATSTDSLYLAGMTTAGPYGTNGLLAKLDFNGNLIWNVSYGNFPVEWFTSIAIGDDGIYVGGIRQNIGFTDVDALLVKFGFDGSELWTETWKQTGVNRGLCIALGSDGVYLAGDYGWEWEGDMTNVFLAKFSFAGIEIWNATWGGLEKDQAFAVTVKNESIYVTGSSLSYSSSVGAELFLLKYNSSGTLLWLQQDATELSHRGLGLHAYENTVFVAGAFKDPTSGWGTSLLNYNETGELNWKQYWKGAGNCYPSSLAQAIDSLYVSGTTEGWLTKSTNGFLIKFGFDGESAPGPIALIESSSVSTFGSFIVSWTPAYDPDGSVEDYELQMDTSPIFDRPDITWIVNDTSLLVTNRPVGTYYFRVRARDNTNLYGPWSNVATVSVVLLPPTLFNPWLAPTILILGVLIMIAVILFVSVRRWRIE